MFQRFKGLSLDSLLDPTLAEQQNKKEQQTSKSSAGKGSPGTSNGQRRGGGRTSSPLKRGEIQTRVTGTDDTILGKALDPEEFVIGEDLSDLSRTATPKPRAEPDATGAQGESHNVAAGQNKGKEKANGTEELPEDVRKKLVRLEQLTAKYQDLLRNYRNAHKRVQAIEPFEATLREHTTLNSILDPGALSEFLSVRDKDREMIMGEFRRVTDENNTMIKERDNLKAKLEQAEKKAKEAFDEAAGLRQEREETTVEAAKVVAPNDESVEPSNGNEQGSNEDPSAITPEKREEDFFSYETETQNNFEEQIAQYEVEIKGHKEYITELLTDNASLNHQLELSHLNLSAMENKITIKDREITSVRANLSTAQSECAAANAALSLDRTSETESDYLKKFEQERRELEQKAAIAEKAAATAEASLKDFKAGHDRSVQHEDKGLQNLRGLIGTLRDQITNLENSKAEKEAESKDLQFAIKRLEAQSNNSGNIILSLRGHEATADALKKKLAEIEHERDAAQRYAESKKGHEGAVASLRSQLKRAEKDRDTAYQLIIECGRCEKPTTDGDKNSESQSEVSSVTGTRSRGDSEDTAQSVLSTQPTEISAPTTPSIETEEPTAGGTKKKSNKKKKSKSKKSMGDKSNASEPTVEELMDNPSQAIEMLQNADGAKQAAMLEVITRLVKEMNENRRQDEVKEDTLDEFRQHLEDTIEKRDQMIKQYTHEIATLTDMNLRQDQDVKTKADEIKTLKAAIAEKEVTISSLNARLNAGDEGAQVSSAELEKISRKVEELEAKIATKQSTIDEQVAAIDRLDAKLKDQDGLTEEIEDLRESLVERAGDLNKIQDLKEATVKAATGHESEREALNKEIVELKGEKEDLEKQLQELKKLNGAFSADLNQQQQELNQQLEDSRKKSAELETQVKDMSTKINTLGPELETTSKLAKERYQKVADLQKHCNDVLLPKIKKLEEENASMKTSKADAEKANIAVKKLESRERDLKSEIIEYKSQVTEKSRAFAELKESVKKAQERSTALEDSYENARRDLEKSQSTRDEAVETRGKLVAELRGVEQELKQSKTRLEELEKQVKTFSNQANSLRDELQLKSAQHASSQSNMDNLQDQTRELATQMKEARERNTSLEEELSDAHRLLSERSREAETMRRLLSEVEGKAESRVKEMRERLDMAVEERDRAEDEASSNGRRKAREMEDIKNQLREAQREAGRAIEAREDAERRERDFKIRQVDFERNVAQAQEELTEVRAAMAQLRNALDESERQARELEKERVEIRKTLQERETRLEKLQKSSKAMTEELRTLQASKKLRQGSVQSSDRSSMETVSPRVSSPAPRASSAANGAAPSVDTMYLKNILLQFFEQKEKKHQLQLVHVLGQLLHFNKQEEQKWQSVISTR